MWEQGGWKDSKLVKLHCQPDWVWSHLGDRTLGLLVRTFSGSLIKEGRPSLNVGGTVPGKSPGLNR